MKSLSTRIALILLILLLVLAGVHFAILRGMTYSSFVELEKRAAQTDIDRVRHALLREQSYLDITCKDWAFWDDTFRFIKSRTPQYITDNLNSATFLSNQLDYIAMLDEAGRVVWSQSLDCHDGEPIPLGELPFDQLSFPSQVNRETGRSGLLLTASGPLLIAVRPIFPSTGADPSNGTLIMGRLMDDRFLASLQEATQVEFTLEPLPQRELVDLVDKLSNGSATLFEVVDSKTRIASILLKDVLGRPALLVKASLPREITSFGLKAADYALYFFWGASALVFLLLTFLLRRIILQPMKLLIETALVVRQKRDLSLRVNLARDDEIGAMAESFNLMLGLLERQTRELERKNASLLRDTQRRKKVEEDLRSLDRMKNEFISAAAHELNTPLTSIIGYAELLNDSEVYGGFDEKQKKDFLLEILSRGEALEKVISDLLDVSHFESGQPIRLNLTAIDPRAMISRLLRRFQLLSPLHRLEMEIVDELPLSLQLDEYRLNQVLENLLSNAIKYSPQGGVITIRLLAAEDRLAIDVIDQGIGMNEEQVARVFDKFYRADASNTAIRGLGLGMSIVKRIIEAHKGHIEVASTLGEGTTVHISLPLDVKDVETP